MMKIADEDSGLLSNSTNSHSNNENSRNSHSASATGYLKISSDISQVLPLTTDDEVVMLHQDLNEIVDPVLKYKSGDKSTNNNDSVTSVPEFKYDP